MYLVFIAMLALNIGKEVLATLGVLNDDLESSIEEEFEDDGEDTTAQVLLQEWEDSVITSISRLENQMNSHISEISDLRNMIAGLNQQLGEVAAFADRLNGRIDEMQNK